MQPIILIGAARSGTKLLRDVIARHPAIDRVPYDVNYIWRQGNEALTHDELLPSMLTPALSTTIQKELAQFHRQGTHLIEKTVSNCLRIEFVQQVYPNARFIYLLRNGVDVVESVYRQWTAPPDWRYILAKSRTFPLRRAPGYAISYATNIAKRLMTNDEAKLSTWGPRYAGIDEDMQRYSLLEVCARQWVRCVGKAENALTQINQSQVLTVRYEDFVQSPHEQLLAIASWLSLDSTPVNAINLADISAHNIGKGRSRLCSEQLDAVMPILEPHLAEQAYV